MEDRPALATAEITEHRAGEYRCPGETHSIDRALHLARLASFYPACRHCAHRGDARLLAPLQIRQWAEVERRTSAGPRFTSESLASSSPNELTPTVVRRLATALASVCQRQQAKSGHPLTVLVAADGHWSTAELVAAACESLQWAGCRAIEIGGVTSASLAQAARAMTADAALLVGNVSGEPHALSVSVWGADGQPWSSPGGLDLVRAAFESPTDRLERHSGGLERFDPATGYLAPYLPMYHGLRPLRFVLDTTSAPFARYLSQLTSRAACQILRPQSASGATASDGASASFVARRLNLLGQQIVAEHAHFGVWISGDGEVCHLVDERGSRVDSLRFLLLLFGCIGREKPSATIVRERGTGNAVDRALTARGARIVRAEPSRQGMCEAIVRASADFGGGSSGRFWFSGSPPTADALLALSLLLTVLSESDRPLSEVLDAS